MNLSLLGPPGSGKGTIGHMLQQKLGIPSVCVGQKCREEIKGGTAVGKRIQKTVEEGDLVSDEDIMIILKKIREDNNEIIWDGFPRAMGQIGLMEVLGIELDHVLFLNVSEEIALARVGNRWTCRKCQEIYNIKTMPPKEEGKCDDCGGELYQRADQTPEALKERIKVYHEQTLPIKDYYEKKGILITVDAAPPPETVFKEVLEKLGIS